MKIALALSSVSHHFNDVTALNNINITVSKGERVALLGPSGAGKSTLLELLDRQQPLHSGTVQVLGKPLERSEAFSRSDRADVGFIFQEFALLDRLSVYQNVMNGRLARTRHWSSIWGQFDAQDHLVVSGALANVGLSNLASRRADELSGGQRQRVAVARCLAQEPKVILADEPVSNLDPAAATSLLALITSQAGNDSTSVVFSSHQPDLAQRFSDRVIGLRNGEVLFDQPSSSVGQGDIERLYDGSRMEHELRVVS